jgi:hypothetical protein
MSTAAWPVPANIIAHADRHDHAATAAPAQAAAAVLPADTRRWLALAVASLVLAGLLSLVVVAGRIPLLAPLFTDPLFFRRCLVVHVDLALIVWFYAFLAALVALGTGAKSGWTGRAAFALAVLGVVAMLAGALLPGAEPVLANYVPVIDHPLFLAGLGLVFGGLLLFFLGVLLRAPRATAWLPADAVTGLRAAALAVVLAAVTWVAARAGLPAGLDRWTHFEFSAWGAGHVLQVANTAAMLAVWLWLVGRATGTPVLGAGAARGLFTLLLAPHFVMPLLTWHGSLNNLYVHGATQLMRWGIFPVVLSVLALCLRHLWRERKVVSNAGGGGARSRVPADAWERVPPGRLPPAATDARGHGRSAAPVAAMARAGFAASAGLTLFGFILGALIRGSSTLVPAHYHASLGGVTVAFMAAAYLLVAVLAADAGRPAPGAAFWRTARRQLGLFGIGQAVFALGFAIGGLYGLGRKVTGAEQHARGAGEIIGLGVMGAGGLLATAAGIAFLYLMLRAMCSWRSLSTPAHP